MNQTLKRRQFCQMVLVSTAAAVLGNFTKKTLAREVVPVIYGVSTTNGGVTLQALYLMSDRVHELSDRTHGLSLEANERLSGFTVLADGTFVLSTAPLTAAIVGEAVTVSRLIFLLKSREIQTLSPLPGLDRNSTIESLQATNDGSLLSIVSINQGVLPFRLANINSKTGEVDFNTKLALPPNRQFSNITQCPDGTIYATSIGQSESGATNLVQLDLKQGNINILNPLRFNNKLLTNSLRSLACSPSGQLYALADPTYQGTNSLFTLDANTGVMTLVRQFNVDKITFKRNGNTTQSIFTNEVPSNADASDNTRYELGMKFQSAKPGQITAIRYWKAKSETGTHVGRIWALASGAELTNVTFSNETASGWQQQALSTPLNIEANTTYVVSVNSNGYFAISSHGLESSVVNGDLSSVADGNNGVFGTPGSLPTNSYENANYFRDIVFTRSRNESS